MGHDHALPSLAHQRVIVVVHAGASIGNGLRIPAGRQDLFQKGRHGAYLLRNNKATIGVPMMSERSILFPAAFELLVPVRHPKSKTPALMKLRR